MIETVLSGKLVRLSVIDPENEARLVAQWGRDSEFSRLLDGDPAYLYNTKQYKEWIEKNLPDTFMFAVHALEGDQQIGFVDLSGIDWVAGDGWVGIGLGERDYWGKGYGSEAMNLMLRFAFHELNLRRVSLDVFEYNPRGIRSYEKCGFRHEGRARQGIHRFGRYWDVYFMGILRAEWEALQTIQK
jgi:RimJ/RimL family protein N-acetyltransferase